MFFFNKKDKRIYSNCDLIENNHENDKSIKRIKLFEDGNNDYLTGFDIENNNTNYNVLNNNGAIIFKYGDKKAASLLQ
uniref:Uncharacterized protein n=1 Tax=Rhizophagus irregularis (strain DAOM 181602 / DAOM 197198 / MUCL 43194) TaxID=747089 RepID=U9U6E5_RHIID